MRFTGETPGVGAQSDPEAILTTPHSKTWFNEVVLTLSICLAFYFLFYFILYHFFLIAGKHPII